MSHKRSDDIIVGILAKYSEYFEVLGDKSPEFLIKILANLLANECEKTDYLNKRVEHLEHAAYR